MEKGEYNGICNVTACDTKQKATYYHRSARMYYCKECADRINNDSFNKRDSMHLYGNPNLCIEGKI